MNILEKITEYKKQDIEIQKKNLTISNLKELISELPPAVSFERKFQECIVRGQIALIAEIKKASPSKGLIREDFKPLEIAKIYESCNASAISVLTEEHFFLGSLEYLKQVKANVSVPVLRKDFIIDEYQIYESRAYGADIILLISSVLSKNQLKEFNDIASTLGLSSIVETHSKEDFEFYLENNTRFIGINNRDLTTFKTDVNHTIGLIKDKHLCRSFIISESGISTFADVSKLSNAGVSGILIGEHFMKQSNIKNAVNHLMGKVKI